MVARLKLKGIDGRAPPGVEPAGLISLNTGKLTRSRHSTILQQNFGPMWSGLCVWWLRGRVAVRSKLGLVFVGDGCCG